MYNMRRIFLNYCLTIVTITLLLVLTEILITYSPIFKRADYYSPDLLYNHPIHGYQSVPNSRGYYERADFINLLVYNNYGRHDYYVKQNKEKDRIVTLGGSFTAGLEVPVEKTWPKIFEKKLNGKFEVINMGHQGKMFNYFSRYLDDDFFSEIQPDYLIFGFSYDRLRGSVHYEKNEMSCQRASNYKGFSYLFGPNGDMKIKQAIDRLRSFNYFPFVLYERYPNFRRSNLLNFLIQLQGKRLKKNYPEFKDLNINGNLILNLRCNKKGNPEDTIHDITIIKEICRKHSVPLLFFFIPKKNNILENYDASAYPVFKLFSRDDYVIDVFDDFQNDLKHRKIPLYWENDGHPNEEGYNLIAHSIFKYFTQWLNDRKNEP